MSDITWTPEELAEFDKLVDEVSSRNQAIRSSARMRQNRFVNEHGTEKCDAMWAHLQARDERKGAK
jgi:hypothetical protein